MHELSNTNSRNSLTLEVCGDSAEKMPDSSDTDDYETSLQAGKVTNNLRDYTTAFRPCYVRKSVTKSPVIINNEVGSVSIISEEILQRHAMPSLS